MLGMEVKIHTGQCCSHGNTRLQWEKGRKEKALTRVLEMGLITERTTQETQGSGHRHGRSSGVMETGMFGVLF